MRRLLTRVLFREGYRVTALSDGQQLLDALLAKGAAAPDLIISDVRMPKLSGFDLLEHLRQAQLRIPVILISAFCDETTLRRAAELGAACVLSKPFDMDVLRGAALAILSTQDPAPATGSEGPSNT